MVYQTLVQIVEQVNSIVSELIKAEILENDNTSQTFEEQMEEMELKYLYRPEVGNVAFASAIDCWSFTLPGFIPNVAQKLNMNGKALLKFMWDPYYYNAANKQVSRNPPTTSSKVMFVQFIMDALVDRYLKFFNPEVIHNTVKCREAHSTVKEKLSKIMPMEHGIFKMVVDHLPAPIDA